MALYNAHKVFRPIRNLISGAGRVAIVAGSSSNQIHSGYGWDYAWNNAWARRANQYATPVFGVGEGNGNGMGHGPDFSDTVGGLQSFAFPIAALEAAGTLPTNWSDCLNIGTSDVLQSGYLTVSRAVEAGIGFGDPPSGLRFLRPSDAMRGYLVHVQSNQGAGGKWTAAWRNNGDPNYNQIIRAEFLSLSADVTPILKVSTLDVAADAARVSLAFRLCEAGGTQVVAPAAGAFAFAAAVDGRPGFQASTCFFYGGQTMDQWATNLAARKNALVASYWANILSLQSAQAAPCVLCPIVVGPNDVGQSVATVTARINNLLDQMEADFIKGGGTTANIYFPLMSHPRLEDAGTSMANIEAAALAVSYSRDRTSYYNPNTEISNADLAGYWLGGSDPNHLIPAGHRVLAENCTRALVAATAGGSAQQTV